jgi:Holliday junction resolvase RusA-like endonuclease
MRMFQCPQGEAALTARLPRTSEVVDVAPQGIAIESPAPIRIVVFGNPAPQGSKKFVGMIGGHGMLVENSKKVKPWRQDVVAAAIEVRGSNPPIDGALIVRMIFTMPKPKSAPKRRRTWPNRTPDLSKLARSTEDALTTAGIWTDDARVVEYERLAKVFPGEDPEALGSCGVNIEIRVITA